MTKLASCRLESFGISDIGLVRQNNEDNWAALENHYFYVLADGMGGHKAGEVASKEAIDHLCHSVRILFLNPPQTMTAGQIAHGLQAAIRDANKWVYQLSLQNEDLEGMGTTLCCFLLHENNLIYAHVGDSRVYRFRDKLQQLTRDHSLKREMITRMTQGPLPSKHVITRAIGTSPRVEPELAIAAVLPGDIYFLCSDGLTDAVAHQEIAAILQIAPSVKEACTNLVKQAKINGGHDNITLVMTKIM